MAALYRLYITYPIISLSKGYQQKKMSTMGNKVSIQVHEQHLAQAMELFEECHDNPRFWDAHDRQCHDKLIANINHDDGYDEE